MPCKCQECNVEYHTDIIVPDTVWERIKPKGKPVGGGLLCPACIGHKLEFHGVYRVYMLTVT